MPRRDGNARSIRSVPVSTSFPNIGDTFIYDQENGLYVPQAPRGEDTTRTVLPLGDSITAGNTSTTPAYRRRRVLNAPGRNDAPRLPKR